MRVVAACALALPLVACASPQRQAEQAALQQKTQDCLVQESVAVAPQPIDLDTAALAVLARCDYPGVLERSMAADYPGTARTFTNLFKKDMRTFSTPRSAELPCCEQEKPRKSVATIRDNTAGFLMRKSKDLNRASSI